VLLRRNCLISVEWFINHFIHKSEDLTESVINYPWEYRLCILKCLGIFTGTVYIYIKTTEIGGEEKASSSLPCQGQTCEAGKTEVTFFSFHLVLVCIQQSPFGWWSKPSISPLLHLSVLKTSYMSEVYCSAGCKQEGTSVSLQ